MKRRKIALILGMCFLASALQIGCGGASKDTAVMESAPMAEAPMEEVYYEDNAMGMVTSGSSEMKEMETMDEVALEEEMAEEAGQEQVEEVRTERKLIRTVDLNLETENYDSLMEGLEQEINRLGGYIEYKDAYHGSYNSKTKGYRRNANITARIPANKLDEFTGKVAEIGNITYESESVEDVTLQYVDLSSHKKMLMTEQERLMELLENADTMEDIITIESRLSEVRYQIESMESQLRTFDNQVDYSTVHIFIEEVERYTPQPEKTTWERIKTGFGENVYRVTNGIKNFAIEFIIAIPVLLVWAVVIMVGVILVRVVLKRKHGRDVEKIAKKQGLFQSKKINEQTSEDSDKL